MLIVQNFIDFGGKPLVANNSLFQVLSSVYPEHEWLPWKFTSINDLSLSELKIFINWVLKQLNIHDLNQLKSEVYREKNESKFQANYRFWRWNSSLKT